MTSVPHTHTVPPPPSAISAPLPGAHGISLVLAGMLALLPAVGMPSELVLQDTLKSALLAGGTLGAAWVWWWAQRGQARIRWQWHGILLLPLLLLAYALGSMLWSHSYLAGVEAARWAVLGLLLWLGLQAAHPSTWMRWVWGVHWGAVGACLWAAAQFWGDLGWFPQAAAPASTFVNRNFFAEYIVCTLPFSVFALAKLHAPGWRQLMALSVAFNTVALLMTGTRSALAALLLITPALACIVWRYRHQLAWGQWSRGSIGSVLIVGALTVLALGNIPSRHPESLGQTALSRSGARAATMAEKSEYTVGSFSYRSMMWKGTARMLMDKPWHGVGAGAWEVFIPFYQGPSANVEPDYYAHNEYLQLLAEYGLPVGGGVLAVLLAYLMLAARNTWQLPRQTPEAPLRAIALTSLLALLVVSLAGFPWRLAGTGALFMLNLALLASSDARLQLRDALGQGVTLLAASTRRRLALALLAGTVLAGAITVQALRAETSIMRGIHALNRAVLLRDSDAAGSEAARAYGVTLVQHGMAINPHYRKVISLAAEQLAGLQDWENSSLVLHSIAASRPNIADVWSNLVLAHLELGAPGAAQAAWQELVRLQADTARARALELMILSRSGQESLAVEKITAYFDQGIVEYDVTLLAYSLGLRLRQWDLAERGLRLLAQKWPERAADSYFRLGNVYVEAGKGFEGKALAAFQQGWQSVPEAEKSNYRGQVPTPYREQL